MFPTPPELREELHEFELAQSHRLNRAKLVQPQAPEGQCLCGCASQEDNSGKVLKIKILLTLLLVTSISLVGLNAYQRDAAQALNPNPSNVTFQNPAGAIQAAESTFPTLTPINDMPMTAQTYQMQPQMQSQMQSQPIYPQYNAYVANPGNQIPKCMYSVQKDAVGERMKRFVTR